MKVTSNTAAAVAAYIFCCQDLASASPVRRAGASRVQKRETIKSVYEIQTLGGTTFKINQVPNERFSGQYKGRGAMAMAKAYSKYGTPIPDDLLSTIEEILEELGLLGNNGTGSSGSDTDDDSQGEVKATPLPFDVEYLSPVEIGTPAQTLMLDFDTGSSDLWVFSTETPANQVLGQTVWDIAQSSTARKLGDESWAISYGDGSSSSGNVYLDVVSIGGVTVEDQAVESATKVSVGFTARPDSDGLVGLAFGSLNRVQPTKQKTFWENAATTLASPLFTANLKKGEPGNYNFGFIDTTEFTGDITYVPVNASTGFWTFDSEGFQIAGGKAVSAPHQAIADTGTTLLLLPQDIVDAYYAQVTGASMDADAGGYVFPCSATLPDYTALIDGYQAVIPASFINLSPVDSNDFDTATTCFGGIQAAAAGGKVIYGDVFLKAQFVVFHGGNQELGFANKPLP